MSLRNLVLASIVLFSLAFLVACGSSSSVHVVPPPNGGFSNSNLNGTYVFSVAGTDQSGAPYAMVGTITADGSGGNGNGHITAGTLDINDPAFTTQALPNQPINSSSIYTVGVDGRGRATLGTSTPFGTIILDFVLQDSSHGLVTEFDGNASGSGTLDAQTASVTPQGPYALSLAGSDSTGNSLAAAGNFTVGSGGTISSGSEDFNDNGFGHTGYALSGTVVSGPSSTPGTTLVSGLGSLIYDVYAIDASHLKFIEMDTTAILSGDAFSQTSTTIPAGTYAFTLAGIVVAGGSPAPSDAGGFLVTDGSNYSTPQLRTSTRPAPPRELHLSTPPGSTHAARGGAC
jgi:hypothetical protein